MSFRSYKLVMALTKLVGVIVGGGALATGADPTTTIIVVVIAAGPDVAEAILGAATVDIETTQTATVDPADGEDRLDLVTLDETGTASVVGDPATDPGKPIAPEIPEGEVLLGLVYVRGGSVEVLPGDLLSEYRTVIADVPPALIAPQGEDSGLDADLVRGQVLASESGTVSSAVAGDSHSVTFDNTYSEASVTASVANGATSSANNTWAGVESVETDADGNVIGATIATNSTADLETTARWEVIGLTSP